MPILPRKLADDPPLRMSIGPSVAVSHKDIVLQAFLLHEQVIDLPFQEPLVLAYPLLQAAFLKSLTLCPGPCTLPAQGLGLEFLIVGTNGLAQLIAHFISTTTSHQFVILSRRPVPGLTAKGWQVLVTDYNNSSELRFKLAGVDTVISTVSGEPQLSLIDAAASARVRRFIPAEFGGPPALRPQGDPLDNHRRAAIIRLSQLESTGMRFAVFTCGVFYERFAPGGMASSQIGVYSGIGQEGDYIMNIRRRTAQLPYNAADGHSAMVCVTGARDVAQFVVAALSLSTWPREFRMRGERMSVRELVSTAEHVVRRDFEVSRHTRKSLSDAITYARAVRDEGREGQLHHLVATAEGRFDFTEANLNHVVNHRPERFRDYLTRVWASA